MTVTLEELSKLDHKGAMDLLFAYTTDLKRHEKDISDLEKEIALWNSRVGLAEKSGRADLATAAGARAAELGRKRDDIAASAQGLRSDIARLKEALPGLKARERSIDPDLLLAELSMLATGDPDPERATAERELDKLARGQAVSSPAAGSREAAKQEAASRGAAPAGAGSSPDSAPGKPAGAAPGAPGSPSSPASPGAPAAPAAPVSPGGENSGGMEDALAALKRKMGL